MRKQSSACGVLATCSRLSSEGAEANLRAFVPDGYCSLPRQCLIRRGGL